VQWLDSARRGEWFSRSVTALYRRSAMPPFTRRVKGPAQSFSTSRRTHKGWRSADLRSRRSRETPRMRALSRASRPTIGCVNRSGRTIRYDLVWSVDAGRSTTSIPSSSRMHGRARDPEAIPPPLGESSSLNPKRSGPSECATELASVSRYDPWLWPRGLSLRSLAWLALARRSRAPKRSRCNLDRRWR
jgi:hypothetical protein